MLTKPIPIVDDDSRPYWDAARDHRLAIPKCDTCGRFVFYPRALCPSCNSDALRWEDVPGVGVVYSFTVVRFAISAAYAAEIPYVVALIRLEEGVVLMANIIECAPEDVQIGMRVEVTFQDLTDEVKLPQFRPAGSP